MVFRHLLRLFMPYFQHRPTGTLVARVHAVLRRMDHGIMALTDASAASSVTRTGHFLRISALGPVAMTAPLNPCRRRR